MELTRFQKRMLAALAGMLVFFGLLMAVFHSRPGAAFEDGLLRVTEQDGRTIYSGKAQGTPVTVSVAWTANLRAQVEFTIGEELHDVFDIEWPLEPIQTKTGETVNGIRVVKNNKTVFEGGCDPESAYGFRWFDVDGEPAFQFGAGSTYSGPDPWRHYKTSAGDAVRFALGPESAVRGDPFQFAMAVVLSVFLTLDILFHKELFRWRHWAAKDPEPTEDYLALERIGWVILAVVIAAVYLWALTEIY